MIRISGDIWDDREDFRWVFARWQEFMPLIDQLPAGSPHRLDQHLENAALRPPQLRLV